MKLYAGAAALIFAFGATVATAQNTAIQFGGLAQDTSLPVEVASDELQVSQTDGTAIFTGNVLVTQGEMKLSAERLRVIYGAGDQGTGDIEELRAMGGVTLVNGAEAAESQEAVYNIDAGSVVMTGDVILTQGQNALSSNQLTIDLNTGTGTLQGRVRTVFQTGSQ